MNDIKLPKLLPCPFCGSRPWFKGDAAQWQDDSRYVELSIVCCANMTETIGWDRAREMSPSQREDELKSRLIAAWNKRTGKSNLTDEEIDAIMP